MSTRLHRIPAPASGDLPGARSIVARIAWSLGGVVLMIAGMFGSQLIAAALWKLTGRDPSAFFWTSLAGAVFGGGLMVLGLAFDDHSSFDRRDLARRLLVWTAMCFAFRAIGHEDEHHDLNWDLGHIALAGAGGIALACVISWRRNRSSWKPRTVADMNSQPGVPKSNGDQPPTES